MREKHRKYTDTMIVLVSLWLSLSFYYNMEQIKYIFMVIVTIPFVIQIMVMASKEKQKINNKASALFWFTLVVTMLYGMLLRDSIVNSLIFISSIAYLDYLYKYGFDKKSINVLITCTILILLFFLWRSLLPGSYVSSTGALVLAYENPNMAGIALTAPILILIVSIYITNKKYHRIFMITLLSVSIYLLVLTQNRGSLISVIVFISIIVAYKYIYKIYYLIRITLVLLPIIAVITGIAFGFNFSDKETLFNKPMFSTRLIEWKNFIILMMNDPLSLNKMPSGGLNMAIASIVDFGFLGYLGYILFILSITNVRGILKEIDIKVISSLALLCIYIQQSFESTLVYGSYGVYVLNYSLIGLAYSKIIIKKNLDKRANV